MQGTIVLLMAFSGLGCHHTPCNVAAPTCYETSYAVTTYDACTTMPAAYESCDTGCGTPVAYDSCYDPCSRPRRRGLFAGLFGCFAKKRNNCAPVGYDACSYSMAADSCCSTGGYTTGYSMPVYGDYSSNVISGSAYYPSAQVIDGGYTSTSQAVTVPAATEPPPPPVPATEPAAAVEEAAPAAEPAPAVEETAPATEPAPATIEVPVPPAPAVEAVTPPAPAPGV
jgi:hypothetical protein